MKGTNKKYQDQRVEIGAIKTTQTKGILISKYLKYEQKLQRYASLILD